MEEILATIGTSGFWTMGEVVIAGEPDGEPLPLLATIDTSGFWTMGEVAIAGEPEVAIADEPDGEPLPLAERCLRQCTVRPFVVSYWYEDLDWPGL